MDNNKELPVGRIKNFHILADDLTPILKKEKFDNEDKPWNQHDTNYRLALMVKYLLEAVESQGELIEAMKEEIDALKGFLNID